MKRPQSAALIEGHLDWSDFQTELSLRCPNFTKANIHERNRHQSFRFQAEIYKISPPNVSHRLLKWHHWLWNARAQRYVVSRISGCIDLQRLLHWWEGQKGQLTCVRPKADELHSSSTSSQGPRVAAGAFLKYWQSTSSILNTQHRGHD